MKKLFCWVLAMVALVAVSYRAAYAVSGSHEVASIVVLIAAVALVVLIVATSSTTGVSAVLLVAITNFVVVLAIPPPPVSSFIDLLAVTVVFIPATLAIVIAAISFAKKNNLPWWRVLVVLFGEAGLLAGIILTLRESFLWVMAMSAACIAGMMLAAFVGRVPEERPCPESGTERPEQERPAPA
ncbi:MAG: hypothetical protein Q8P78_02650 [bacterium]|nr:hypothetical protein [bacterium]